MTAGVRDEPGSRTVHLDGDGVRLAADRWEPTGPDRRGAVVLLHGGGQTRHSWRHTARRLAAAGWTVLALDLRGHGDSEWSPDGDYTLDAHVADLRSVTGTLDKPPVLIGASLGGMTSLLASGTDPCLARGLVLVDVTPTTERAGTSAVTRFMRAGQEGFPSLEAVADAVAAYNPHRPRPRDPRGLLKNLRRRAGRWYWHWDPRLVDERQTAPETLSANERRARAAARDLAVPTMLVRGAGSDVVSPAGARELLELVPDAWYVEVDGTGHMVAGDDNDVFTGSLLDFMEHVAVGAAAGTGRPEGRP
ncbi:Hydrolase [Pseudonocardia sp. Ae168_Ps1]|uniref:alpha/beta fold hydrolase n=1 Tax=unclassified Pseudonocardia TaxID=2619320 RepID=UPI00094ADAF2|nr:MULTISPECIES: alpha/beta hydrolase [unclassified Pseudonocardia]OLL75978.1 Hydrolase [Pseudonocardia sp. Ae150A_Ps1]OLL81976.1 Hydrolase [Pseudonocardia sp. Ae168_Ps1]OLL83910.1 Hydrolase [Pseudonocardia sp. Ae263_Ps1]OLL96071.1 Hydrolase [Pseudonocardia sp. Ae356_Ps1]